MVGEEGGPRKRARTGGLREQRVVSEAYPESEYNLNPGAASAGARGGVRPACVGDEPTKQFMRDVHA